MKIPTTDGEVLVYSADPGYATTPRIYYVNGIQTSAATHANAATVLSVATEHAIVGVYNQSGNATRAGKVPGVGFALDLLQCASDWTDGVSAKTMEIGNLGMSRAAAALKDLFSTRKGANESDPASLAEAIRVKLPDDVRSKVVEVWVGSSNPATASLFRQLRDHRGGLQMIVAHSQGNLITANALWAMTIAFGEKSLADMRVYSLASPSPAWPLGIRGGRRKVYGHTDDVVTLADPHNWTFLTKRVADGAYGRTAGDWRVFGRLGIGGHDLHLNMLLNFLRRIRSDLGLPPFQGDLPPIK